MKKGRWRGLSFDMARARPARSFGGLFEIAGEQQLQLSRLGDMKR